MCVFVYEDGEEVVIRRGDQWERRGKADIVKRTTSIAKVI